MSTENYHSILNPNANAEEQLKILANLNDAQKQAVLHFDGPALVLAGAGSGKTNVLTKRIALLISKGIRANQILALTFTNKAAREMKERVCHFLGDRAKQVKLTTFHALGALLLRQYAQFFGRNHSFTIYDTDEQQKLLKEVLNRLNISPENSQIESLLEGFQQCKDEGFLPEDRLHGPCLGQTAIDLRQIAKAYSDALKLGNAFDFGDLILCPYLMTKNEEILACLQHDYPWVLVDEFQDTNLCQFLFLKALCPKDGNLFVVGDDDQSIYAWRGADVRNMLDFKKHYPNAKSFVLDLNYRSHQNILDAANAVIRHNVDRHVKSLKATRKSQQLIELHECNFDKGEAIFVAKEIKKYNQEQQIPLSKIAVLYRNNSLSLSIEDALKDANIPYDIVKGFKFYDRAEIKDAIAYLKLMVNPNDEIAFRRAIASPSRGVGDLNLKHIINDHYEQGCNLFESIDHCLNRDLLKGKAKLGANAFSQLYYKGQYMHQTGMKAQAETLLKESGFLASLTDEKVKDEDRLANVYDLLFRIEEFEKACALDGVGATWQDYLEQVKLITESDRNAMANDQKVSLSTIHSAKGLEFDLVFLIGLEDKVFPGDKDPSELSEERRLFYVALTRAKDHLILSHAKIRNRYGRSETSSRCRFINDIPTGVMKQVYAMEMNRMGNGFGQSPFKQQFWGGQRK
jgi:DNA helicase-2/ATP-dependent DNA helicase PcrA